MAQSFSQTIPKLSLITSTPSPLCTFLFVGILCILGLYSLHHHPNSIGRPTQASASPNDLHFRDVFLTSATNTTLSGYLRTLTLHPHLAGTTPALQTAHYVQTHFRDLGLETHVKDYNALLSYPRHASLSLHFTDGSVEGVSLAEPGMAGDDVVRPYHAYSPSGSAYGKPVFVNYGREEDYRALAAQGVSVAGCVAVARRGEEPRNVVVDRAAEKGAAAVLMYAETTEGFKGGVERGTVMKGLGDPLTPGWAGVDDGERLGVDDSEVVKRFPKIPSMPISAALAEKILRSLEGGKVPYQWRDTLKLKKVGPGPTLLNFTYQENVLKTMMVYSVVNELLDKVGTKAEAPLPIIELENNQQQGVKKMVTIHNVFAIIRGSEEPDRFVLLGNHRDAWTFGAVDPNSGTAALLDIARRYALLLRLGWNPRRSIILCSWDAEEFGMVGSTEWVEQNLVNLGSKAVAYLNVDCAVQGPGFFAAATPQLDDLLVEVTKTVKDPDAEDMTLYKRWTTINKGVNIRRLSGVDSDFAPFLQHAGVPSLDLYYGRDFPVYHTAFDSYDWMTNYGDPLFQRHVAVTGVWGLLALHLADDAVLPLNYLSYAAQLQEYTNVLSNLLEGSVSLHPITASICELAIAAKAAEEEAKKLREQETVDNLLVLKKRALNDQLMFAERGFLDAEGLHGRQWFKHLVYGPKSDHESKLVFFPGIVDAISESQRMNKRDGEAAIQHEIWRVARAIQRAAYALRGELT